MTGALMMALNEKKILASSSLFVAIYYWLGPLLRFAAALVLLSWSIELLVQHQMAMHALENANLPLSFIDVVIMLKVIAVFFVFTGWYTKAVAISLLVLFCLEYLLLFELTTVIFMFMSPWSVDIFLSVSLIVLATWGGGYFSLDRLLNELK